MPDIAVLAKAISNGYPMAVIIGTADVMQAAQDTFISSTYWTERIGLVAAIATIEKYRRCKVEKHLDQMGKIVKEGWERLAKEKGVKVKVSGINPLAHMEFVYEEPLVYKTFFTQEMLKRGFLATNVFYASYAHTEELVSKYLDAVSEVFDMIASYSGEKPQLDGEVCHSGFQRLA